MKVSVETTNGLVRKATVAVPSESFEEQVAERVRSAASELQLPGFRPGKVPLQEVQRRFGDQLRYEIASELLQSSFAEAVQREGLSLASKPSVEIVSLEAGRDLEYVATFEVLPTIDLKPLDQLSIRRPTAEIEESDIDATVQSLREQRIEWQPVERPAATGDRVTLDYVIKVDGETVDERQGAALVLGDETTYAELETALLDMSATETRAFPLAWKKPHLASAPQQDAEHDPDETPSHDGASAENAPADTLDEQDNNAGEPPPHRQGIGEVTLHSVEESHLPDVDDAFFDWFGVEQGEDRPAQFRIAVRERMQLELAAAIRRTMGREVKRTLAATHTFDLPEAMVEAELQAQRDSWRRMFSAMDLDEFGDMFRNEAERQVRMNLVMREIVVQQAMTPDDERVRSRIDEIAGSYEESAEVRRWLYSEEEQLSRIENAVLEDQVVDHVLTQAQVTTVPGSYQDVIAGRVLEDEEDDEYEEDEEGAEGAEGAEDTLAAREISLGQSGKHDAAEDVSPAPSPPETATATEIATAPEQPAASITGKVRRWLGKKSA